VYLRIPLSAAKQLPVAISPLLSSSQLYFYRPTHGLKTKRCTFNVEIFSRRKTNSPKV